MQQNTGFQIIQDEPDGSLCGYDYYQMLFLNHRECIIHQCIMSHYREHVG